MDVRPIFCFAVFPLLAALLFSRSFSNLGIVRYFLHPVQHPSLFPVEVILHLVSLALLVASIFVKPLVGCSIAAIGGLCLLSAHILHYGNMT